MISNAKAIPHGHAHLEYIKGESPNKKHKDKIFHVCKNILPKYVSGAAIWEEVCELTADSPEDEEQPHPHHRVALRGTH